jgi:hypothetical protein
MRTGNEACTAALAQQRPCRRLRSFWEAWVCSTTQCYIMRQRFPMTAQLGCAPLFAATINRQSHNRNRCVSCWAASTQTADSAVTIVPRSVYLAIAALSLVLSIYNLSTKAAPTGLLTKKRNTAHEAHTNLQDFEKQPCSQLTQQ